MKKQDIRQLYKQKRLDLSPKAVEEGSTRVCDHLKAFLDQPWERVVGYLPMQNEVDIRPFLDLCASMGKKVFIPVFDQDSGDWKPAQPTPGPSEEGSKKQLSNPLLGGVGVGWAGSEADLWLVPGIVFDHEGYRIGFGKGIYDRLLKGVSGLTVGIGYSWQVIKKIPRDPWDVRLSQLVLKG